MELMRIGVDTSKHVFTLHGVDASGAAVLRRDLRRGAFEVFMAKLAPTDVAIEACGGSHHWARRLGAMGHRVRLIPPQYVKPFVKRSKTDRADAEAICEAAGRPSMRFVPVKTAERQGELMVLRTRELLVRQRTQVVNALRGHAADVTLQLKATLSPFMPVAAFNDDTQSAANIEYAAIMKFRLRWKLPAKRRQRGSRLGLTTSAFIPSNSSRTGSSAWASAASTS